MGHIHEREKKAANDREKEKENLGGDERGAQSITHTHTHTHGPFPIQTSFGVG